MNTEPDLRVLFVHQSSDLYGSDRVLLAIARAVNQSGGQAIVALTAPGPLVDELQRSGIEVHPVGNEAVLKLTRTAMSATGLLRLCASVPQALKSLDRVVAGRQIHRVHSNTLAVLAGALWARRRGVRHVWHLHEMVTHPRPVALALPLLVRALADDAVCNSQATLNWLLAAQPALAARARLILNGIEVHAPADTGTRQALAQAFRPAGATLAVGLVGRINRWKGQALLLQAAELLHAAGRRDFSLVFVGSAPPGQDHFLQALQQRIAASPLAPRVVLQGFMPEVSAAYAALDVVCMPSTEAEPFGLVAAEAMAAGRPVVAARIGGLPEVVEHGRTGLLHEPGNAADLARCLAQLLDDEACRRRFGAAGRERFDRHFSATVMTRQFVDLYAQPGATAKLLRSAW